MRHKYQTGIIIMPIKSLNQIHAMLMTIGHMQFLLTMIVRHLNGLLDYISTKMTARMISSMVSKKALSADF
jgi:hypothetical protein